jgi:hypothetical protein
MLAENLQDSFWNRLSRIEELKQTMNNSDFQEYQISNFHENQTLNQIKLSRKSNFREISVFTNWEWKIS